MSPVMEATPLRISCLKPPEMATAMMITKNEMAMATADSRPLNLIFCAMNPSAFIIV